MDTRDVLLEHLRKLDLSISEDEITTLDGDVHTVNVAEETFALDVYEALQPSPRSIDSCGHPKHSSTFSTDDKDFYSKLTVTEAGSAGPKKHAPQRPRNTERNYCHISG